MNPVDAATVIAAAAAGLLAGRAASRLTARLLAAPQPPEPQPSGHRAPSPHPPGSLPAGRRSRWSLSLGAGLARNDGLLIAMRGLQGLGAAVVLPAALSIVMNMFSEGAERNQALGIWGGIAGGVAGGIWMLHRRGANIPVFMDAAAPGLLVAQAIGRIGNYFNQELFGGPTKLPWGLEIEPVHRPPGYLAYATFNPTFLYEMIWNVALAAVLFALVRRSNIRAPGVFALYVAGYSGFRIFEELLRVDPAHHILGMRLNFWVACLLTLAGAGWFAYTQRARAGEPEGELSSSPA